MPVSFEKGDIAPDFTLNDQDGEKHTLSEYKGCLLYTSPSPRD